MNDEVLSRPEDDPLAPAEWKAVEATFQRVGKVVRLTLATGATIRTSSEHPFWVMGKGWTTARELTEGDRLATESTSVVTLSEVAFENEYVPLYNLSVADYHTYFVGEDDWSAAVWAHNSNACTNNSRLLSKSLEANVRGRQAAEQAAHIVPAGDWSKTWRSQSVKDAIKASQQKIDDLLPGGINGHHNGFWAKAGHDGTHKDAYFLKMWDLLKTTQTEDEVVAAVGKLKQMAQNGAFK